MADPLDGFPSELRARFEPSARLGAGGSGIVFRAFDRTQDRLVAVKVVTTTDEAMQRRAEREAQALARVSHPHVLELYEVGRTAQGLYLVEELLEGRALDQPGAAGAEPVVAMLQVAEALDAVHAAGLVHRDVKPANVVREAGGRTVLIDFNLAHDPQRTRLTGTGMVVGTPAFMAPEMLMGDPVGPAADWYSWGASLYWLLEGRLPLDWQWIPRYAAERRLPEPSFAVVRDAALRRVIRACLAYDPRLRPAGAAPLRALLAAGEGEYAPTLVWGTPAAVPGAGGAPGDAGRSARAAGPAAGGAAVGPAGAGGPGGPGGTAWRGGLAGAALVVVGLGLLRAPGAPPLPGPVGMDPAVPAGSPVPAPDLVVLDRELDPVRLARMDPHELGRPVDGLEATAHLQRWAAAGGRGAALDPGTLARLRALDRVLADAGAPRPLHPYLLELPGPGPLPTPPGVAGAAPFLPAEAGGWLGRAIAAADRLLGAMQRMERQRTEEPAGYLGGLSTRLPLRLGITRGRLGNDLLAVMLHPDWRRPAAAWMRPAEEALLELVFAAAEAVRTGPATSPEGERAVTLALHMLPASRPLWLGSLATSDPAALLAGASDRPALAALEAACRFQRRRARADLGLPGIPDLDREDAALAAAVGDGAPGAVADQRRSQVLWQWLDRESEAGPAAMAAWWRAQHLRVRELDPQLAWGIHRRLVLDLADRPALLDPAAWRDVAEALRAAVAPVPTPHPAEVRDLIAAAEGRAEARTGGAR